ncbi:MAG TPA: Ig-like domain-containing protein [Longimicrobium sp.]|nr:Ig-like domain-containing protein [Longimicrobium sp.]
MIQQSRWFILAVAVAVAAAACGDGGGGGTGPEPQPSPVRLQIVSGDGQGGFAGETLFRPLVVRATRDGQPVPSVAVTFAATDGELDGAVTRTTDASGEAGIPWKLPADPSRIATARVRARMAAGTSADSVVFSARSFRADEMDLVLSDGGRPVKLLAYDRGAYQPTSFVRRDFTDSAHVQFADPALFDELVAFTPGRAPLLLAPSWTPGRDTVQLRFSTEVIRMPMTIWVVQPPFDSIVKLVQRHLKGVEDSWEAQAGIGLRDVRIVDATGFAGAPPFQNTLPSSACNPTLYTEIGRDAGRLNAYYVGQPPIGSAGYCGDGAMMIFPLAWERAPYTLAHEIGHGFLGGHHETLPDNVMHFQGSGTRFSPGQMFRAHYSETSILNTMFNAHPPAMRRPCSTAPVSAAPVCPPTNFVLD